MIVNAPNERRTLVVACAAHALHDGYTDLIYVLLPVWQTEFALGYGLLALLRGLYAGTMAIFQVPAGVLARRWGSRTVLALGTLAAALGYGLAGKSGSLLGLCAALTMSGLGSSVQHPIGSASVSRAFGPAARQPLAIYNFSGDLGKAALPAAGAALIALMPWRHVLWIGASLGIAAAMGIALCMPRTQRTALPDASATGGHNTGRGGFRLLLAIGILDTSVRMGLLTFLPFILQAKGASLPTVGLALAMVFLGGAAGKFVCGWLGSRLGVLWTVIVTEGGTAAIIMILLALPLLPALWLLPLLGVMLNGTSSVLYGTVPELTPPHKTEHAFAVFYTGTIGAGALGPVCFGLLGDVVGAQGATVATAITALATLPLAMALSPKLTRR